MELNNNDKNIRMFQPNITCSFDLMGTPDNILRHLIVTNNDKGVGICDEQIVTTMWEWVKEFMRRLEKNDMWKVPKNIPTVDMFLSFSHDMSRYMVSCASASPKQHISDCILVCIIAEFAKSLAEQLEITLEGAGNDRTRGRQGVHPEMQN